MEGIYKYLKKFNESTTLLEYDRKDLKKWAGPDLTNRFFTIRNKLQAPENDLGYWIKKGDLQAFEDIITDWETGAIKSNTQKKKEERIAGAELILNEKGWKVYHITTYEAARQLGSNTTWCITGRYHGMESKGKHFFDKYINELNLDGYYFIFDTMNTDHGDVAKYCAGVTKGGQLEFLYNGMQDHEISRKGIPNIDLDRRIELIPGIDIKFNDIFKVVDGVLTKIDYEEIPSDKFIIPEGIIEIKKRLFEQKSLRSVVLPTTIKKVGLGAFNESYIESLVLPYRASDVEFETGTCFGCDKLKSVAFQGSVKSIGSRAFAYCENLTEFIIRQSEPIAIAEDAFKEAAPDLKFYSLNKSVIDFCLKSGIFDCSNPDTGEVIVMDGEYYPTKEEVMAELDRAEKSNAPADAEEFIPTEAGLDDIEDLE